jgi:nucleoside-diphosphate-sugar epimerase
MRVVVTGANGFVGRRVCQRLSSDGHEVVSLIRRDPGLEVLGTHQVTFAGGLSNAVRGADALVHLAAKTEASNDAASEAEALRVNVDLTASLAEAALRASLKRFIFVSSIKVNGEQTHGVPFTAAMPPAPQDTYGRSKARAEQVLRSRAEGKLEFVVLRPPVMYGPGMKGNLARLFEIADRGIPMPFGSITNSRDMLSVNTFVDLISKVISHPAAAGRTFLVRDGKAISTPELFRAIARSLGRRARLVPMPKVMLSLVGSLSGRSAEMQRLVGDLEIDDKETRDVLQWSPKVNMDSNLAELAEWWKSRGTLGVTPGKLGGTTRAFI